MKIPCNFLSFALAGIVACAPAFSAPAESPTAPVLELVKKLGIDDPKNVSFRINPKLDGFTAAKAGTRISIVGGSKSELAAGYGYYLRHAQNLHWSWSGSRFAPNVPEKQQSFKVSRQWDWRYAYNYCTLSYTSAFWSKQDWADEIDRMALSGMKQMLVQAGLEKVWQLTLSELGYPKDKIIKFIPNPAFAAWWNMGNLEGHGGPLSQGLIDREAELGKFIVERMRGYGMVPVLQGFVGLVPHDLGEHYKSDGARYIEQGNWCDGFVRPAVLDPTTPAFQKVAAIWYKNMKKVYGIDAEAFGGDLFHEGGKSGGINVAEAAKSVQDAMQKASPGSTWVLQAWHGNPSATLLSGLDKKKCMVLALCKNLKNGADNPRNFHGAPWVWCELGNFGGNQGLYGSLKVLGDIGKMTRGNNSELFRGIGMISEGTEVNPIYYDFLYERIWEDRTKVYEAKDIKKLIAQYTLRRYGKKSVPAAKAWELLEQSVYSPSREQEGCTESILCAKPGRNAQKASTWASGEVYWNPGDVVSAFKLLIEAGTKEPALQKEETYRWDLCDVGRQMLADLARPLLAKAMEAYDAKNKSEFEKRSAQFLDLISGTDKLLATHELWRFGRMYQNALAKGKTPEEKRLMGTAAKTLVTRWGRGPGSLNDYAHRQLAGLMKDYYMKRWTAFFDAHKAALSNGGNVGNFGGQCNTLMMEWSNSDANYSRKAEGNTFSEAAALLKKWEQIAIELHANAGLGKGRPWTLRDGAKEFTFDVSDEVMSAGNYTATFNYASGASALAIKSVRLFEGTKLVSEDKHKGTAGIKNDKNVYRLNVKKLRTNLDSYVLKAEVEGVSSNDSAGTLVFKKAER